MRSSVEEMVRDGDHCCGDGIGSKFVMPGDRD